MTQKPDCRSIIRYWDVRQPHNPILSQAVPGGAIELTSDMYPRGETEIRLSIYVNALSSRAASGFVSALTLRRRFAEARARGAV